MLRSIVRQRAIAGTLCGTSLRVTSVAAVPRVLRDTRVSPVHARAMAKRAKGKSKAGGKTKRSKGYGRAGHVVISLRDVDKYFESGDELFRGVQLGAFDGAKIGVVGVNGAGKSTLLRILAGVDDDFEGERIVAPGVRVGYLRQEPELDDEATVEENVLDGVADKVALLQRHAAATAAGESDAATTLKAEIDALGAWGIDKRIYRAMRALRCPPPDAPVAPLSGGERRRVALCKLLVSQPDVLLLDEPTNHLDAASVAWLQHYLEQYRGTVIAITHDRYFLDGVAGWILEVDRGQMLPFQGNYSEWLVAKQRRLEAETRREGVQKRLLARELAWIHAPQKARQAKSKARVAAYEERLKESQRRPYESGTIVIPPGRRLGGVVLEVAGLSKAHGDKQLFRQLSFKLYPGQMLGVVGANGTGKTSLLKILTGEDEADEGTVKIGETVDLGFVTQSRDSLNPDNTVYEEISDGEDFIDIGSEKVNSRQYVAAFNFKSEAQQKLVGVLSGGERNRVHLAKMIKRGPNVLLLDEPTNDLDVEVLRNLENAIEEFSGSGIVVSHDRWFLDRVCTNVVVLGDGEGKMYNSYAEYAEELAKRGNDDDDETNQPKFRSLGM